MGHPRKYVQINGREVPGVSRMPDGRYYIIVDRTRRRYFRSVAEARATYLATQGQDLTDADRAILAARAEIRRTAAIERLEQEPWYDQVRVEPPVGGVIPSGDVGLFRYVEGANALADLVGDPEAEIKRVTAATGAVPTNTNLSSVLAEWRRLKKAGDNGRETSHIKGVARVFSQFVKVVGDVAISTPAAVHFRAWREWVLHETQKRASGKWSNDRHAMVKMVLRSVRRHNDDWPWPAGLSDWLKAHDRKAYQAKPDNRQLLPVAEFHRLVKTTELRAGVQQAAFDPHTQRGRGQRRQAVVR